MRSFNSLSSRRAFLGSVACGLGAGSYFTVAGAFADDLARTPHIHFKIKQTNRELLTTQMYINGHPQNRSDGLFRNSGSAFERELILVDFVPLPDSRTGELTARFDVVTGVTPQDAPPAG